MIRTSILLLCTTLALLLALDANENQINFSFEKKRKGVETPVPGWATTMLIATSPSKPLPLILVGRPLKGEMVLIQPEDDEMVDLLMKDETGAELFEYDGMEGSFTVDFAAYSGGYPKDRQLGRELFDNGTPPWTIEVDEITAFRYLKAGKPKLKGGESGREWKLYEGTLNGRLKIGDKEVIKLEQKVPIRIIQAGTKLRIVDDGPPQMSFSNAHVDFRFTIETTGKAMGWKDTKAVTMDVEFHGYADVKKGTDKLFKDNLPKINLGPQD